MDIASNTEYISSTELNRKLAALQERQVIWPDGTGEKEGCYLTSYGKGPDHRVNHFAEMNESISTGQ